MRQVVIVDGFRTPFCKENTYFADLQADKLGELAIRAMITRMARAGIAPAMVDCVVGANVATPMHAPNPARTAAVRAGLRESIPADTIGKNCASGLAAVYHAANMIRVGDHDTVLVVGMESMSNIPVYYTDRSLKENLKKLAGTKDKFKQLKLSRRISGKLKIRKNMNPDLTPRLGLVTGLTDTLCGQIMGKTAETLAKIPDFGMSREKQDLFALRSHAFAHEARLSGFFKNEIEPVFVESKNGYKRVSRDNGIRTDNLKELFDLKPFFDARYGSVTIGNSSQITDGAACILLMAEDKARSLSLSAKGRVGAYTHIGFKPEIMGLSAAGAIGMLLKRTGMSLKDFSAIEINEAFAAVVLTCLRVMASKKLMEQWFGHCGLDSALGEIPEEVLNLHGGAIALGHPVGATGLRLIVTLLNRLEENNQQLGLAAACVGGGQGAAMVVERA